MRVSNAIIIIGAGLGLAGLIGRITDRPVIVVSSDQNNNAAIPNRSTLLPEPIEKDFVPEMGLFSDDIYFKVLVKKWLPKFGHPKRKTNKQRCKHNAKLKRRK